jgi:nucleoid-associated protein YgaU
MLTKKSRYRAASFFAPLADGSEVFPGLRAREIGPATGVVEHEVQAGDRLDQLARHYYNSDRYWYRIVDANPEFSFGPDMLGEAMAGRVILIPKLKE